MKNRSIQFIGVLALFAYSCQNKTVDAGSNITISPEAGTVYKAGDVVNVKIKLAAVDKLDSVVYLLDSVKFASKKDSSAVNIKTDSMALGARVIIAKVYHGGISRDALTNIFLMASKAPEQYTYKVDKVYPHDTSAYTEGLLYQDGYLYETTGTPGHSDLRKVDLETGKVIKRAKIGAAYFGEGSAIIDDKIVMLTLKNPKIGFVFDKNTFKQLSTFNNSIGVEGWGMTYDGKKLYMDDSTNRIWFLDKDNYRQIGYIDVYDDKRGIDSLNEMEYIDNKIYANIYTKDTMLVINPKTGAVLKRVDMKNLWPLSQRPAGFDNIENVLNGIAWDEKSKRLFVTGKKWPHLYQISLVKK